MVDRFDETHPEMRTFSLTSSHLLITTYVFLSLNIIIIIVFCVEGSEEELTASPKKKRK